ncbi:hypothetical protein AUJ84_00300 [Candidatus Pacearchaeota archaeon CG1_02_32_132]|nr:MAG: hypothetical protein AUJ84_00300 [Candidatus Pacearchaeota archaeon CG1_02_32_132]
MIINKIRARAIKDSRNELTIEVEVNEQRASSPSGKSKGRYESKPYYKDLKFCVSFLNNWKWKIEINNFKDLIKVEKIISKELRLKRVNEFGGNSLFAFESAILKALAKEQKKELWQIINPAARKLPVPAGNVIGGGLHSNNKNHPVFQEFLIIPKGKNIRKNYRILKSVYLKVGEKIKSKKINDEGAWQTDLSIEDILSTLSEFKEIRIGLDIAASSFYKNGTYNYNYFFLSRKEQIDYINRLIKKYEILYTEDPLDEEDFSGFRKISKNNLVVGDDLTVTNFYRVKKAIKMKSTNAVIVKPNQTGSLLEVDAVIKLCKKQGIKIIFSHRSGETMDSALADYAFGFEADYIKCGIATKWRDVKLKRLLEIDRSKF